MDYGLHFTMINHMYGWIMSHSLFNNWSVDNLTLTRTFCTCWFCVTGRTDSNWVTYSVCRCRSGCRWIDVQCHHVSGIWLNHVVYALVYNNWGLVFLESGPYCNMFGLPSITNCWITKPWAGPLDFDPRLHWKCSKINSWAVCELAYRLFLFWVGFPEYPSLNMWEINLSGYD